MKNLATITNGLAAAALAVLAVAVPAPQGANAADTMTPQQERMKSCNAQASGKTGDDRKAFMSGCLKGDTAASGAKLTPQQQRMKDCNARATGKTGDDRKAFMSGCLKG